ncbi:TrmH family RNA methyltransferase [Metallibacterium scheffleri]
MPRSPPDPRRPAPRSRAARVPMPEPEQRLVGVNACLAAFARRPQDLRKLWLVAERQRELRALLAWCVRQRIGYRIVAPDELQKLSASTHHEGVCAAFLRPQAPDLQTLLRALPAGPALLLWLDGVGNPHNLGAILRSAAHFGVAAVLVPESGGALLSSAALRVAEGGAEAVPLLTVHAASAALAEVRAAGFAVAASTPHRARSIYAAPLPARALLALGTEGAGLDAAFIAAADVRLRIPGSGAVESLNVAAAAAVLAAEWFRCHAPLAAG